MIDVRECRTNYRVVFLLISARAIIINRVSAYEYYEEATEDKQEKRRIGEISDNDEAIVK